MEDMNPERDMLSWGEVFNGNGLDEIKEHCTFGGRERVVAFMKSDDHWIPTKIVVGILAIIGEALSFVVKGVLQGALAGASEPSEKLVQWFKERNIHPVVAFIPVAITMLAGLGLGSLGGVFTGGAGVCDDIKHYYNAATQ